MAIQYATDDTFEQLIKQDGVVIVDFFGAGCRPCEKLGAVMEEIDDELPFINIVKVDVDKCVDTAGKYEVNGIPDVYYYKDGKEVDHQTGFGGRQEVDEILKKILY